MTTATAAPASPGLVAADRCDRCGAQAYVRALLLAGGELLFCAHHARMHEDALRDRVLAWHDETGRLHELAAQPETGR